MRSSRHRIRLQLPLTGAIIGGLLGCTSASQNHRHMAPNRHVITARDIERSGAVTAWDAVRLVAPQIQMSETASGKPKGIGSRGQSSFYLSSQPMIFLDGTQIADFRELGEIPAREISTIHFMSGIDVSTRYGTGGGNGAILIRTKRAL